MFYSLLPVTCYGHANMSIIFCTKYWTPDLPALTCKAPPLYTILYYTILLISHSFLPLSQLHAACIQYPVAASVTSWTPPPNHTLLVLPPIPLFPPSSMREEMLPALGIQWQLLLPAGPLLQTILYWCCPLYHYFHPLP